MTGQDVRKIFQSGADQMCRATVQEYGMVARYIADGYITVSKREYLPAPVENKLVRSLGFGGGEDHKLLAYQAFMWLLSIGERCPLIEYTTDYGRPDLLARSLEYVVECGNTNPMKMVDALSVYGYRAFILFRFPYVDFPAWQAAGSPLDNRKFVIREIYEFRLTDEGRTHLRRDVFAFNFTAAAGL